MTECFEETTLKIYRDRAEGSYATVGLSNKRFSTPQDISMIADVIREHVTKVDDLPLPRDTTTSHYYVRAMETSATVTEPYAGRLGGVEYNVMVLSKGLTYGQKATKSE